MVRLASKLTKLFINIIFYFPCEKQGGKKGNYGNNTQCNVMAHIIAQVIV